MATPGEAGAALRQALLEIIGKCGDCKFWDKRSQFANEDLYGCCMDIGDANKWEEREAVAYISDCMEGGPAHTFHTRADFGCKLFQRKGATVREDDLPQL